MIYLYGLCYRILQYADKTVERLRETASEDFNLICVESKSYKSNDFLIWAKQKIKEKKIQKFISSSTNCKGDGLRWAIENIPPDDSEDFFIMTDLDLLVPKNVDWIKEIRDKIKNNVICGYTLSNENYVKPNWGWHENDVIQNKTFGTWLMGIKKEPFSKVLENLKKRKLQIEDSLVIQEICKYGKRDIIDKKLYHLGWDSWKDDPYYWDDKQKIFPTNGWQKNKDEYDIDEFPTYTLYE